MKTIKKITSEGILYANEAAEDCFIDFKKCNQGWIQYKKRTEGLDDKALVSDKFIGQRDICSNPRYIEFFTYPKFTRFEFKQSNESPDGEELFSDLQKNIILAGWTTIDLS